MEPSPSCLALVKKSEGCRLQAYADATGHPTIGYGHTGASVRIGDTITQEQADSLLQSDINRVAVQVSALLTTQPTQGQFDALVGFAYDVGIGNLKASRLLYKLRIGDVDGAAGEFAKWVTSDGEKLPDLIKRREAEKALFLS